MIEQDQPPVSMRARHDAFVESLAVRLGVKPSAILRSVVDFGLTSADIAKLTDKSGLTRYANGHGLNIIGQAPIRRSLIPPRREPQREFTARKPRVKKKVRPGQAVRKRAKVRGEKSSAWPHDRGATSMADALRKVGLRK